MKTLHFFLIWLLLLLLLFLLLFLLFYYYYYYYYFFIIFYIRSFTYVLPQITNLSGLLNICLLIELFKYICLNHVAFFVKSVCCFSFKKCQILSFLYFVWHLFLSFNNLYILLCSICFINFMYKYHAMTFFVFNAYLLYISSTKRYILQMFKNAA